MLVISSTLEDKISYAHAKQPFDILYITNDKVAIKICRKNEKNMRGYSPPTTVDENIRATFAKVRVPCLNQLDQSFSGKT